MAFLRARRPDLLLALTLLGTAIAGYLSWVAIDDEQEAFCSGVGDCHTVQSSEFADIAGIPIAVLGLGMYLTLLALLVGRRLWSRLRGEAPPQALASLAFGVALSGALYSGYLTWLELYEIEAICAWCVASAVVITLIVLLTAPDLRAGAGSPADRARIIEPSGPAAGRRGRSR